MKRAERNTPSEHPQATSRPWGRLRLWCGLAVAGLLLCAAAAEAGPATGKPVISGPPQVDETLTVDTSAISDTDGLGAFSYQWVRGSTDISGATGSTYTPVEADLGKKLKVKVNFTDGGGNQESVTSDAYPSKGWHWSKVGIVAAKTACPADSDWCAEMTVGYGESPPPRPYYFHYGFRPRYRAPGHWGELSNRTITHEGTTYTVTAMRVAAHQSGQALVHIAILSDEYMPDGAVFNLGGVTFPAASNKWHDYNGSLGGAFVYQVPSTLILVQGAKMTVSVTFPSSDTPATGKPVISGAPQVDETLTVDTGDIADPDGLGTFSYQWIRVDGVHEADISGATGSTYTPVAADVGKKLKVRVSFTDGGATEESVTSDAWPSQGYPWDSFGIAAAKTACPADSDWCTELTVGYGETDDGVTIEEYHYGFMPEDVYGSESDDDRYAGALGNRLLTYGGATLKWRRLVISHKERGSYSIVYLVFYDSGRVPEGTVFNIGGTTFTADGEHFRKVSRNPAPLREGYSYYRPSRLSMAVGEKMTVSVTFPEHATGQPTISGTANVGQTLSVSTEDVADVHGNTKAEDGETGYAYAYQWIRVDGVTETDIPGATSSTYTLTSDDAGKQVKVEVSFTDDAGNAEEVTSEAWPSSGTIEGGASSVTLSLSASSLDEDAGATSITVTGTLNGAARTTDTAVTVVVGATDDSAVEGTDYTTVGDLTLTITAGETTGTATFTLTPTDDDVDEADETLSVTGTTDATDLSVTETTATIVDDDARGVAVSATALSVSEGGTATYTVVLESEPTATVTVTPSVAGDPDVTVSPASLNFTTANWSTAQTVTVSAAHDADTDEDTATVSHAVSGGDYASETTASVSVTVNDAGTAAVVTPLTASFADVPAEHDGASAFELRIVFSEELVSAEGGAGTGGRARITRSLTVTGASLENVWSTARPARDDYTIQVTPSGNDAVGLTLAAPTDCEHADAVCAPGGKALSAAVSVTIPGPPAVTPLTASFADVPAEHDGASAFELRIVFSEELVSAEGGAGTGGRARIMRSLTVSGASLENVWNTARPARDDYTIQVTPAGNGAVGLTLAAPTDCEHADAVCTSDGKALSAAVSVTIPGPAGSGKQGALPDSPQLAQNTPNPFNSQTVVDYFLPGTGPVRLEIFSLTGQRVAVLHHGPQQAGDHRLHWDGRDHAGRSVASGLYLYRLVTEGTVLTRKLMLLR